MKRVGWGRRARRALWTAAILVALATAAWLTGWPQERVIAWQFKRNFGAVAVVDWGGIFSNLRFDRLEVYPDELARREGRPFLVAEKVAVAYHLMPGDGRRVRSVHIERATISLDVTDPELPNYGFLLKARDDARTDEGPAAGTQFVPREIVVEEFGLVVATADGRGAVSPIRLSAGLLKPESPDVRYQSGRAVIAWNAADGERVEIKNVTIDGTVRVDDGKATLSQKLDAPGLAYTVVTGDGDFSGEVPSVHVVLGEFTLAGNRLAAFLDATDSPLQFDEFDVESGELLLALSDPPEFRAAAVGRVSAPAAMGSAEPLYADTARIEVQADQTESLLANVTLTLAQDQVVRATLSGDGTSGSAVVTSEPWTRDQLVSALPAAFQGGVKNLGFDSFTANANAEWTAERFTARASASSQGGGSETPPIEWQLDAQGPRDTITGIEGTLEARIGDRRLHATATYAGDDRYHAEARVETVQLAPWVQLFAGDEAAEGILGTIEGTVRADIDGEGAPIVIVPEFHLREFAYDELSLDEITLGGSIQYNIEDRQLRVADLHAESIDGMTMFKLAGFEYDVEQERGEGEFTAGANLGVLGTAFGAPDLFGSSSAEGRVRIDGPDVVVACAVMSDYAGLGDILLPYGTKITGDVEVQYDLDAAAGSLTQAAASIGEGTTLRLTNTTFTSSPLAASGELEAQSDLQVLVAMNWLQLAEGGLTQRASFTMDEAGLGAEWQLGFDAAQLVLAGNVGSAEGVGLDATGTYRDGLAGEGNARAAKLTAAGGVITSAAGPVTFDGDTMRITRAAGGLFGGEVVADIDVGVLVEKLPIDLVGSFDGADLAILTDEVKPPNTSLTGTAAGNLAVRYTADGLESFTLNASAPGGLSVNRSLVSDLLQSDRFLAGVGERMADKAMDKLLGTQPQRPFDSGRLNIYLDSGKIQGTAELLSVKTEAYNGLNLTVNLDMDQSALAEALALLEESKLGNVDF